jgi:hypothetical protein
MYPLFSDTDQEQYWMLMVIAECVIVSGIVIGTRGMLGLKLHLRLTSTFSADKWMQTRTYLLMYPYAIEPNLTATVALNPKHFADASAVLGNTIGTRGGRCRFKITLNI